MFGWMAIGAKLFRSIQLCDSQLELLLLLHPIIMNDFHTTNLEAATRTGQLEDASTDAAKY